MHTRKHGLTKVSPPERTTEPWEVTICGGKPEIEIRLKKFRKKYRRFSISLRLLILFETATKSNQITAISLIQPSEYLALNFQSGDLCKDKHRWSRTGYNLPGRLQRRVPSNAVEGMTVKVETKAQNVFQLSWIAWHCACRF